MTTINNKLPLITFTELAHNLEEAAKRDGLNKLLNMEPRKEWIKIHPMVKVKNDEGKMEALKYIPIGKVELLLAAIFQEWRLEIKNIFQLANSVCAIVRLHYRDRLTGEWSFHDGTGAMPIQLDAGSNASDLSNIKPAAIQMAAPGAVSYALKDAAEHLGKLFGRDLSRRGAGDFNGLYNLPTDKEAQNNKEETKPYVANPEDEINTPF